MRTFYDDLCDDYELDPAVAHGSLTGYTAGGCRCPFCRDAKAAYERDRYHRNLDRSRRYSREKSGFREWIGDIKLTAGCADCGYNAAAEALDFDHLPGAEKSFNISQAVAKSREVVLAEIAKCEVVCSNCHRIRTRRRRRAA